MKSAFAHRYPSLLERRIRHAERLAQSLAALNRERAATARTCVWLVGRPEEIETFVADIVLDWRAGHVDEESAARAIDAYLGALHEGVRARFSKRPLACCRPEDPTCDADVDSLLAALSSRAEPVAETPTLASAGQDRTTIGEPRER
jgi:hypothetical protein